MHSNASCLLWVPLSPYLDCSKRGGVFKKDLFGPLRGPLRPWPSINRMLVSFVGEFWVSPPCLDCSGGGEKSLGGNFTNFQAPFGPFSPPSCLINQWLRGFLGDLDGFRGNCANFRAPFRAPSPSNWLIDQCQRVSQEEVCPPSGPPSGALSPRSC